ncbi:hypothetical protein D3877_17475 [Azospirillum cavernae]|uniref:Uncharacterized protein n=1 Tax=Azospirillum cavernae TaxID=2320860 RepID=A0A418VXJ4_9PROT|nr:hypothetical protein [Azospirillum cavernae]RJF81887.1 hypothetical protein D3877_17475 [Azospirillum cavernae]
MEDADTARITFEVVNVRLVKRGVWLADVALDFDGVPLRLNGFRVVQETPTRRSVELPAFVDRGAWRPAVELPEEMRRALADEIAASTLA